METGSNQRKYVEVTQEHDKWKLELRRFLTTDLLSAGRRQRADTAARSSEQMDTETRPVYPAQSSTE